MRLTRRQAVLGTCVGLPAAMFARPGAHLAQSALRDRGEPLAPAPAGFSRDASGLEVAPTETHVLPAAAPERALSELLAKARTARRPVAIAGARHTMGGHTFAPNAIVVDTSELRSIRMNDERDRITVGAGARWSSVLAYLDPLGRSVAVMQGYSSFSIGGSIGANVHGWQHDRPPLASTIESMRIQLADGTVVRASRTENAELFGLVLGGYGLFGLVLDADLRVVPNALYTARRWIVPTAEYPAAFERFVRSDPAVGLAYGRLSVAREGFLQEAILTAYRDESPTGSPIPALQAVEPSKLARAVFWGSAGSDYGKALRWQVERWLGGEAGRRASRNQILDEPTRSFESHDPTHTDILQEYFVPQPALPAFVERLRSILPGQEVDLMNVTVRDVTTDVDSFLRYADQPMFSLVLLFHMPRTVEADARMEPLTRSLVDAAISLGGRHYLPYRLHATLDQLERAYPRVRAFFEAKRRYDPELVLRNGFHDKYATL
jgi:FAD/FMN-containing dehydrogenase